MLWLAAYEGFGYLGPSLGKMDYENLVRTAHTIVRASAVLKRSMGFGRADSKCDKSAQVNRTTRACLVESIPHLRQTLQLGLRVTAGLDFVSDQPSFNDDTSLSTEEKQYRHWTCIDAGCGGLERYCGIFGALVSMIFLSSIFLVPLSLST